MTELDHFYLRQDEPIRGCLLALKEIILNQGAGITTSLKYGMPFFSLKGKMFCYLWVHKKYKQPYLGIVEGKSIEHPELLMEKRSRMKIMLFKTDQDLPLNAIQTVLHQAINLLR